VVVWQDKLLINLSKMVVIPFTKETALKGVM
jgi:hypothetical protein